MYKIAILHGAVRKGRQSLRAAKAVEKVLNESGRASVTLIDVKEHGLQVMEERLKDMQTPLPSLLVISQVLSEADGIVFVSPEYNNSYSGALKNTVDYFTKEWHHKPIGVVAASDGYEGGINASNHMQLLILAIDAYAMPYKLLFPYVQNVLDEEGNPLDERSERHLKMFAKEFLWFTEAIANRKKQD